MAQDLENPALVEENQEGETFSERFMDWVRADLVWYAGSFTAHLLAMSLLLLMGNMAAKVIIVGEAPSFDPAKVEKPEEDPPIPERFPIGDPIEEPRPITTEILPFERPEVKPQEEEYNDDEKEFQQRGGGTANPSKNPTLGGPDGFKVLAYGNGANYWPRRRRRPRPGDGYTSWQRRRPRR